MDPINVMPFLTDSSPFAIVAFLVFLALTSPRQRGNKRSGRTVGTGRHRRGKRSEAADGETSAKTPEVP